MAKEFYFRGKTIDELNNLSIKDFSKLLKSRQTRLIKRGIKKEEEKFIEKVKKAKQNDFIKTHLRNMPVLPCFIGKKIGVYQGKEFKAIIIQNEMLGHRLGEFTLTRKKTVHSAAGLGATRGSKFVAKK
ncbi:MAG: 30S ribosomal protein S19 [Candidatus Aenigmarchaeota archaeon ex4484_52]|nr:MAG: 30S ribosomal protein S19 [Candidatus Aenigmarchaeota archaeon ex4484_52]